MTETQVVALLNELFAQPDSKIRDSLCVQLGIPPGDVVSATVSPLGPDRPVEVTFTYAGGHTETITVSKGQVSLPRP